MSIGAYLPAGESIAINADPGTAGTDQGINGSVNTHSVSTTASLNVGDWAIVFQAGEGVDLTGYFDGGISEIMLFDGVLTNDRRELMEGYLAHKWGLTGNLPAAHPYKSNNPYTKSYLLSSDLIIGPDYGSHNLVSQSMADGDTILFYIPNCQNPGVLTVELTYGVGIG